MNNIVPESKPTMTSREIAELTEKEHRHVVRDIENMLAQLEMPAEGYAQIWTHPQNHQEYRGFSLPHDLTLNLVAGYNAKLRLRIIHRWEELERTIAPKLPTSFAQALRLAAEQAEVIERQSAELEAAKPAIEMVERYVEAKSSKCLSDVAKILGQKPQAFIKRLADDGVIFKRSGCWVPYQHYIDNGRFTVKTGESNGHAYHQTRVEPPGIEWLARSYGNTQAV